MAAESTRRHLESQAETYKAQKERALEELEESPDSIQNLAKGYLDSARAEFKKERSVKETLCEAAQMLGLVGGVSDLPNSVLSSLRREAARKQALATSLASPPSFVRGIGAIQRFIASKNVAALAAELAHALCEDNAKDVVRGFVETECAKEALGRNEPPVDVPVTPSDQLVIA